MRTLIPALVATAALGSATAAFAQFAPSTMQPPVPEAGGGSYGMNIHEGNQTDRYDLAIMMLKKKMDRVTREDGGQLTLAHQAGLQAELDNVNRQFGLKPKIARRASFGHHEPAPGGSSAG